MPTIVEPLLAIDDRDKERCIELLGEMTDQDIIRLDENVLRLVEKVYTERTRRGI